MKDFTLTAYTQYLKALTCSFMRILRFDEFLNRSANNDRFCIIRHDVDRRPKNALDMARLESDMGIPASYYFRSKRNCFIPHVLEKIHHLGHEVGYHYECLSDTSGNMDAALINFEKNLNRFRAIVPVSTIAMHGRPFSPHNNLDLWRNPENHALLTKKYDLLGEVYLDINYTNIVYINDTGRNWTSDKSNKRDKIDAAIKPNFRDGRDLFNYLKNRPDPNIIFQVHPERWTDSCPAYMKQWGKDGIINLLKKVI